MILSLLFTEPQLFLVWLIAIAYGITVHEFAHVFAARLQGDDTGERLGRLTLNPLSHIEPLGLLLLLLVGFGWGRPAPYNPYNLKYRKWGEALVALAGPLSNIISLFIFGLAAYLLLPVLGPDNLLLQLFTFLILINLILAVFNMLPIPPLDGSKLLFTVLPSRYNHLKEQLSRNGPWILLILILGDRFLNLGIFSSLFGWFFKVVGVFV